MTLQLKKLNEKFKYHKCGDDSECVWTLAEKSKKESDNFYYFNPIDEPGPLFYYKGKGKQKKPSPNINKNIYLFNGDNGNPSYRKLKYHKKGLGRGNPNRMFPTSITNIIHYLIARDILKDKNEVKSFKNIDPKFENSMKKFKRIYGKTNKTLILQK